MQGLGAFATRHIPAGVRLIEYAGQRLTPAEAEARYPDIPGERHHTYLFAIDDDDGNEVVVDAAVDGNEARFIKSLLRAELRRPRRARTHLDRDRSRRCPR